MARKFTVTFTPCSPAPVNGYKLLWREVGSTDPFNDAKAEGNFTSSPIEIVDPDGGPDTEYEGIIQSDCGDGIFGNQVPWTTVTGSGSGSGGSEGYPMLVVLGETVLPSELCGQPPQLIYTRVATSVIYIGLVLYADPAATSPISGFNNVQDPLSGEIFTVDSVTGEVLADTGESC